MRCYIRVQALLCLYLLPIFSFTQTILYRGEVLDATTQQPIVSATVQLKKTGRSLFTDSDGFFQLNQYFTGDTLLISAEGYGNIRVPFNPNITRFFLISNKGESSVTVYTGYQSIPKERSTGSFTIVDQQLINRRISTNILERLDGVAPGILFNKNLGEEPFNIRGRSTLEAGASAPLIVLDNFPFEGDISGINPNDIESITLLKDAAAASIWGSRAANGVVVITTKKARFNQRPQIVFSQNLSIGRKPNLWYTRNYLDAASYIQAERFLFDQGYYNSSINSTTNRPALSPVVELLQQHRAGSLSTDALQSALANLGNRDLRQSFLDALYRPEIQQQYTLQMRGGSPTHHYQLSVGYDKNLEKLISNQRERLTLQSSTTIKINPKLEFTGSLYFISNIQQQPNPFGFRSQATYYTTNSQLYPYADLTQPLIKDYRSTYIDSVSQLGFLPWQFHMLDEISQTSQQDRYRNLLTKGGLRYKFSKRFQAELQYQQEYQVNTGQRIQGMASYAARNLVNRYSIRNANGSFTYQVPKGGILDQSQSVLNSQNLRGQVSYQDQWSDDHVVNAIIGFEIRQRKTEGYSRTVYGFNEQYGIGATNLNYQNTLPVNPFGNAQIPASGSTLNEITNRFVSYYLNAGYVFRKKYSLNLSARSDGANLFGVRTNEKISPLWSIGTGWQITSDPSLKFRATYGFNGNAVNANSLLTARFLTSAITGLPIAQLASAPNPLLRWEKVQTINLGLDFSTFKGRLSGSLEWYQKRAMDLLQNASLPTSTGFSSFSGNGASTRTQGFELSFKAEVLKRKWDLVVYGNLQTLQDKVISFERNYLANDLVRTNGNLVAKPGKPLFGIWSYPWAGVDGTNGDPLGFYNGQRSNQYINIIANASPDSLIFHGSARPTFWGNLRPELSYKRWGLSVNVVWKAGYYFRRNSVSLNYQDLVLVRQHQDFYQRWQKPGDELVSSVPSLIYPSNQPRSDFYAASSVLVEKGDHIRLQDMRLDYSFPSLGNRIPASLNLFLYLNNIGILWRANRQGIDPDVNDSFQGIEQIPAIRTISLGFQLQFK